MISKLRITALVIAGIGAALSLSCNRTPASVGHAGTWVCRLDGHVFMVLAIERDGTTFKGHLSRPEAIETLDFTAFSGLTSTVVAEPIVSATLDAATLRLTTENPTDKTDRTELAFALSSDGSASLKFLDVPFDATLPFTRGPEGVKAEVFKRWEEGKSYSTGAKSNLPKLTIIDFFGLRDVSERAVRDALQIKEGEPPPGNVARSEAGQRLAAVPGVRAARLELVCCDNSGNILYVGIEEDDAPVWTFRPAPGGTIRLPEDIVKAGQNYEISLMRAVSSGNNGEDDAEGHARSKDPAVHTIEETFITYAANNVARLRQVLHESSDDDHRALAAQVIAYAPNKNAIVKDLVAAIDDPSDGVRNNAMRALGVMAMARAGGGRKSPEVPLASLVRMLNSPTWTDRNKALFALWPLAEKADPKLRAALRRDALPSLVEMARWKSEGHAIPALQLVGFVAGLAENAVFSALAKGDRESVIRAAMKTP